MGARIPWNRRTVTFELGTLGCSALAIIGLVLFDGRIPSLKSPFRSFSPTTVTLHYNSPWDGPSILHNCAQAKRIGQRMDVHTTNLSEPYCKICRCLPFTPTNCLPPNTTLGAVNHCEKLAFLAREIPRYRQLIYLDSDAVVMKPEFFRMLHARSRVHDFLAAYGHDAYRSPKHYGFFNSGVMFIRAIPQANFTELMPRMYRYATGFDQSILTGFVFDKYQNWDSLSVRFHCRFLLQFEIDTPPAECLVIHDRREAPRLLRALGYKLLTKP